MLWCPAVPAAASLFLFEEDLCLIEEAARVYRIGAPSMVEARTRMSHVWPIWYVQLTAVSKITISLQVSLR